MKNFYLLILALASLVCVAMPANAVTLSFLPESQTKFLGESAIVDVVVGGLNDGSGEIVSGFDLTLNYDPSILHVNGVNLNSLDLWGGAANVLSDTDSSVSGQINLFLLSLLTDDAAIAALQTGNNQPLMLAQITFDAIGLGFSSLAFDFSSPTSVINGRNAGELSISNADGSISVISNGPAVPEPSITLLLAIGIIPLLRRCRGYVSLI